MTNAQAASLESSEAWRAPRRVAGPAGAGRRRDRCHEGGGLTATAPDPSRDAVSRARLGVAEAVIRSTQRRDVLLLVAPTVALPLRLLGLPAPLQPGHQLLRVEPDDQLASRSSGSRTTSDSSTTRSSGKRPATRAILPSSLSCIQVVLGTALALFFDLHLRGMWFVRGVLILPMLLTPVVVGLMWRALLNPDWGIVNWALGELGLPRPALAGRPGASRSSRSSSSIRGSGPRSSWSSCSRASRRCPRTSSRRPRWTARSGGRRCGTSPCRCSRRPSCSRRSSGRSTRSARSTSSSVSRTEGRGGFTTTLSFYTWETGFSLHALRLLVGARLRHGHRVIDRPRPCSCASSPFGGRTPT